MDEFPEIPSNALIVVAGKRMSGKTEFLRVIRDAWQSDDITEVSDVKELESSTEGMCICDDSCIPRGYNPGRLFADDHTGCHVLVLQYLDLPPRKPDRPTILCVPCTIDNTREGRERTVSRAKSWFGVDLQAVDDEPYTYHVICEDADGYAKVRRTKAQYPSLDQ